MNTKKVIVVIRQVVSREIIVTTRAPRIGELISSRHVGLFDAEEYLQDGPAPAHYSLQMTAWLIDRSIPWISEHVRRGELDAYMVNGEVVISAESLRRAVDEGWIETEAQEWCCRVEAVRELSGGDADAEVYAGSLPTDARLHDDRQLALSFA